MFDGSACRVEQVEMFRRDVMAGLANRPKAVPCRWLYDVRGSELFTAITELDEYYPTRTEIGILRRHGDDIARFCRDRDVLIEYGAGAGIKSELLLRTLERPRSYVPVDIAAEFLEQTSARLHRFFPSLEITPLAADFTGSFVLPEGLPRGSRLGFFPGSTIGNLAPEESAALLERLGAQVGVNGRAIIGVDRKKDLGVLLRAYDDSKGVTAAFNRNLLVRINRELAGDFAPENFHHEVRWNAQASAIEMHLRSLIAQTVNVSGRRFPIARGETIHTESSRKYDVADFAALAHASGWRIACSWSDEHELFTVFGLARR